jgi:hypothetical protein
MLPSVTDVVNELSRVVQEDPAVLFKVSRQVVAEELGRVKQGFESASIEVLAKRARRLLDPALGGTQSSAPVQSSLFGAPEPASVPPAPPGEPAPPSRPAAPGPTAPAVSSDEPFAAPSELELGWEKDMPIHDAPPESELANQPEPPKPAAPAPPKAPIAPMVPPKAVAPPPAPRLDPASFLRAPAPVVPSAPPPVLSGSRAAIERSDTRPGFEPPPVADERQPIQPPEDATRGSSSPRITTREWREPGETGVATEGLPERTPKTASAPEPEPAGLPPQAGRKAVSGWLIAVAAVLVVAAGLAYLLKDMLFVQPVPGPANVVTRPGPAPAPPTPVPATPTLASSAASPVPAKRLAPSSGKTKGALIVSREWAGRPAIWVIHFTSHKDRAGAEKEAARLATSLGKAGHAIEVDLGEKGIWYRVLIGDFATREEARAYRAELEAKKTSDLGFVYQLRSEE